MANSARAAKLSYFFFMKTEKWQWINGLFVDISFRAFHAYQMLLLDKICFFLRRIFILLKIFKGIFQTKRENFILSKNHLLNSEKQKLKNWENFLKFFFRSILCKQVFLSPQLSRWHSSKTIPLNLFNWNVYSFYCWIKCQFELK